MIASDRIFGLVVLCVALAFIASAFQVQTSFLSDPVGPKSFPILIGSVAAICSLVMILRPDPEPGWPGMRTFAALGIAVAVLVVYAYALKPLGFIIPTLIGASILSFQIHPRPLPALLAGAGLSVGLFGLFKFVLGLGLIAFPSGWFAP
jgi:putative tricarboxylic transport membrane protein